jgi:hypothetical protein
VGMAPGQVGTSVRDGRMVVVWITVETEAVRSVVRVVAVFESVVLIVSGDICCDSCVDH